MEELNLKLIITQYPDSLNSSQKLKGLICDLYPKCPRGLVNTVVAVAECGILGEIQSGQSFTDIEQSRWMNILENDYGLSPKFAERAILLWSSALGKTIAVSGSDLNYPTLKNYDALEFEIDGTTLKGYSRLKEMVN